MEYFNVGKLYKKTVLITGASSGIGKAVAKILASYGVFVIVSGRNISALDNLCNDVVEKGHPEPTIYPINLATATADDYQDMYNNLAKTISSLDGIVHCAGTLGSLCPLYEYSIEEWYQVWQVNFNSRFLLTKFLLPLLQQSPNASIVLVAPSPTKYRKAYWGPYSITASANEQLMHIWNDELQGTSNIKINMLCPPPLRTSIRAKAFPASDSKDFPPPESICDHFLQLLHPDNKTSGKVINIAASRLCVDA